MWGGGATTRGAVEDEVTSWGQGEREDGKEGERRGVVGCWEGGMGGGGGGQVAK